MGTNQRRTAARVVEDYFQRVYARFGPFGLGVMAAATVTPACALVGFATTLVVAPYAGIPTRDVAPFAATNVVLVLAAFALGLFMTRRMARLCLSWQGEGRTAGRAVEIWTAVLHIPRVLAVRTGPIAFALVLGNQAVYYEALDLPWAVFAAHAVGDALVVASVCVATMLYLEFLVRPALADVARLLPDDFEPAAPPLSLRSKAVLPIPGVVVFTGLFVGGLVDTTGSFHSQIVRGIAIMLGICVLAIALCYVLVHAVLDPIDQLTDATRRVRRGDLDARVPVVGADELGGLAISFNQMLDGLQERERLRAHNTELSTALEESLGEVRASRARIVAAADDERRRMERDLHDGAQQRLVMISLKVAMAAQALDNDPGALAPILDELRTDSARAVDELRDLAHGIYPPLLESDGLASALEDVADQSPLPVTVEGDGIGRYPAPVEAAVYSAVEAFQNTTKHAGPGCRAAVRLGEAGGALHFTVGDDGRGFDAAIVNGTAGLQNMKDRIGALGGTVRVESAPGAGTRVEGTVPV